MLFFMEYIPWKRSCTLPQYNVPQIPYEHPKLAGDKVEPVPRPGTAAGDHDQSQPDSVDVTGLLEAQAVADASSRNSQSSEHGVHPA